MSYKVELLKIEPAFYNCWLSVCKSIPKNGGGGDVEKYFLDNYKIELIAFEEPKYSGEYSWREVVFENKESFVLFMFEWA